MADKKISQLVALTTLTGNEEVVVAVNGDNFRVAASVFTSDVDTAAAIGLGNVDNTADADKPVSTAQQSALDLKAPIASPVFTGTVGGVTKAMVGLANVDNTADSAKPVSTVQQTALDLKAPIASPVFTGIIGGITKSMAGLANVDNTADADKPVSTAQGVAIAAKAAISHTHPYVDISDLAAFITHIKEAFRPVFTIAMSAITASAATADVTFTTTNGRSMTSVAVKSRFKEAIDSAWTDLADVVFVNGTLVYASPITGLTASTLYDVEVYLLDTNDSSLVQVVTGTFTTTA